MSLQSFEFKARVENIAAKVDVLLKNNPLLIGEDHQIDTYFHVNVGRLKLREGNIENALIHYERSNTADAKLSSVILYQHQPDKSLKEILIKSLGVKAVVDKKRKIYFIENVKFHFDTVQNLGTFIEVEAIDKDGSIGINKLKEQCAYYADLLKILPEDYVAFSYSDMIIAE